MYTAKPQPTATRLGVDTRAATLRQPWWAVPDRERLQMHAYTRPSHQLRNKVRQALMRSLHYTSLYRRLILKRVEMGTTTKYVWQAIHRRLTANAWEGSTLLKFLYDQLYNGKLAKRYGNTPIDECPLCHRPDSCTHIAGECPHHKALTINRHTAACQLVHVAIWNTAKGEGALHRSPDLVLISVDACRNPQTSQCSLDSLSLPQYSRYKQILGLCSTLYLRKRGARTGYPSLKKTDWSHFQPLRPNASKDKPKSPKIHAIGLTAIPPRTMTRMEQRRPTESPRGSYQKR
jgi:hypothetical protein